MTDRLAFATTKPMTIRGAISFRVCRVCNVSCDITTAPPATTNSTNTVFAMPAFIDQIEATRPDCVTSGVASSVCPNKSRIGFHAAMTRFRNQLSIAYRTCAGMSNRPGFFSTPPTPGSSVAVGSGVRAPGSPGSTTTGPDGTGGEVGMVVGMVGPMNGGLLVGGGNPDGPPVGKGNTGGVGGGGGEVGNRLGPSLGAAAGSWVAAGPNRSGPAVSGRTWPEARTRTATAPAAAAATPTTGRRRRRAGRDLLGAVVISGDDLLQDGDQQRGQRGQGVAERGVFERLLRPADGAGVAVGGQVPHPADRQVQRGDRGQQPDDQGAEPADDLRQRRRRGHHHARLGPRGPSRSRPDKCEHQQEHTGPWHPVARGLPARCRGRG